MLRLNSLLFNSHPSQSMMSISSSNKSDSKSKESKFSSQESLSSNLIHDNLISPTSNTESIEFNNALPIRFQKDIPEVRDKLVDILYQPKVHLENENHNNKLLKNQPESQPKKKQLLLLVKGALSHVEERYNLRSYYSTSNTQIDSLSETNLQFLKNYHIQIKFIVGHEHEQMSDISSKFKSESNIDTNLLEGSNSLDQIAILESVKYNDIIIGDFQDSYENLVLKSLTGLEWFMNLDIKSRPDYLLLVDDDVDVKINELIELIKNKESEEQQELRRIESSDFVPPKQNPMLLCPWKNARKARITRRGPWAVPVKSYSASHWPSYCGGACYLMNYAAASQLYESARSVISLDSVPVEDAFITGVLRERAHLELESVKPVCVHNYKKESVTGQFLQNKQHEEIENIEKQSLIQVI